MLAAGLVSPHHPWMVQRKQVCCLANCKCCIVCLVVFAWSRVHLYTFAFFCYEVVSLYIHIYIYACCRIGVSSSPLDGAKKAGLLLGQLQVLHCVPCCVCLVKSASVESFVFFCHQVVSLSVYIYMLGAGSAPSSCRMVQS